MQTRALVTGAELAVLLTTLLMLLRGRAPRWGWLAFLAGAIGLVVHAATYDPKKGWDLRTFWEAGRAVRAGGDPYAVGGVVDPANPTQPLNPPTALPLFAAFGTVSFSAAVVLWTAANALGCLALAPFAHRVLLAQGDSPGKPLPPAALAVLTPAVALSHASRHGLDAGQLAVLATLALLAALYARASDRPLLAGALLAVSTVKAATLLPFLVLFLRRKDWPAWVALAAVSLGLCLLATPPARTAERCRACLANIDALKQPGHTNDYAFQNVKSSTIIALDHLFYRLGLRDRTVIQGLQLAATGLLGLWVLWRVAGRGRFSPPAACSLVAFYSALFLYHRLYDLVILTLPLVYCTRAALSERGRVRWLYVVSAAAVMVSLWLPAADLERLTMAVRNDPDGHYFLEAVVLPAGDWAVLIGLFAFAVAESIRQRRAELPPQPAPAKAISVS